MADLENVSPFYISNTTTNKWKRTPEDKDSFGLLTVTPREIQRLDAPYDEDIFLGKLEPENATLSEAMAMSAAALSQHMGKDSGSDVLTDMRIQWELHSDRLFLQTLAGIKGRTFVYK